LTKFKPENNASNKLGKVGGEVAAAEPGENIRIAFLNPFSNNFSYRRSELVVPN
jgi:hypothetical protein